MNSLQKIDLESERIQKIVQNAVTVAMESPLREPILEAVEESTGAATERAGDEPTADGEPDATAGDAETGADGKSRLVKLVQGAVVFAVMFVVLYVVFSRLTADETN